MASRRGTLIFCLVKHLKYILSICTVCLLLFLSLLENGAISLCTCSADLSFSDLLEVEEVELEEVEACVNLYWMGSDDIDIINLFFRSQSVNIALIDL